MKLRLVFPDNAPKPASVQAYTNSTWEPSPLVIEAPAEPCTECETHNVLDDRPFFILS